MPGVRRRLRDVGKKVSGVLAGPRDESARLVADDPEQEPIAVIDTTVPAAEQAAAEPSAEQIPTAPAPASAAVAAVGDAIPSDAVPDAATPDAATPDAATPDAVCLAAVQVARAAAVEVAGPAVGPHLGAEVDGDLVVTHSFATSETGYVGWRWAVTVARAEGAEQVTVDEVVLLPGVGALLAPAWVPWSERVLPGDLTPGDLLPPESDDPRLVPSYTDVDAEQLPFDLHRELGLFRPRVLSWEGRADAAERWLEGPAGPDTPMAKAAPGHCGGCGFLVPLAGALGAVFGACANGRAPDDGRVVALTHGCGAHSETVVEVTESSYAGMAVVDDEFEVVEVDETVDAVLDDAELDETDTVVEVVGVLIPEDVVLEVDADRSETP